MGRSPSRGSSFSLGGVGESDERVAGGFPLAAGGNSALVGTGAHSVFCAGGCAG